MSEDARTISFRAPQQLVEAMEKVADREMCSVSYLARRAVLRELRAQGVMTEPAAA